MNKGLRILSALLLLGFIAGGMYGYGYWTKMYKANTPEKLTNQFLLVYPNTTFEQLTTKLVTEGFLIDKESFLWAAKSMSFGTEKVRAGRFKIDEAMGNKALVRLLQLGKQSPVKVSLHNKRMIEDVAGQAAKTLLADSAALMAVINDSTFLAKNGYNRDNFMTTIIPNTYEVFWNTEPQAFWERMIKEHDKFWTEERKAKAKKLGFTPTEIYIVASIVEKETRATSEKSRVAGVYFNRLKQGWKLEADPTVVYANKDFTLNRILNKHLATVSPYNTYLNMGLPPGPIYLASIETLDKTLDAEAHDYMFFCAAPNNSATHVFAKDISGHNANAAAFHTWLTEQMRIKREQERQGTVPNGH